MDLVACSRCGRIHPRNECRKKRIYPNNQERKMRSSYLWTKKAKQIKEDALGLCEVCKDRGGYNYKNLEVHHITKLSDNPEGLIDDNNLICLCVMHHKEADAGELKKEYLLELANKRINSR